MQVIEDATAGTESRKSVMGHEAGFDIETSAGDSTEASGESGE